MKAIKSFNVPFILLFFICSCAFSQNGPNLNSTLESENNIFSVFKLQDVKLYTPLEEKQITIDYVENQDPALAFARTMLGVGAGFGFGEDQTLWCLHAAYYLRLKMFTNSALYGSFGAAYSGLNNDNFSQSIVDMQLKLLMFSTISRLNEIRLIYGILGAYGFGSDKFDGFTTDITRFTLAAVLGLQLMLAANWSIALITNMFTYQSQTLKPESGGEFKDNFTNVLINKNNLLTLSLIFHLGNKNR
jgi:opacity protein-like surface antigen